jgi:hypothetical protein
VGYSYAVGNCRHIKELTVALPSGGGLRKSVRVMVANFLELYDFSVQLGILDVRAVNKT